MLLQPCRRAMRRWKVATGSVRANGRAKHGARAAAFVICAIGGVSLLPGCTAPEPTVSTPPATAGDPHLSQAVLADGGQRLHLASLVENGLLVSSFGRRHAMGGGRYHRGLDIAAPSGTPVRAAASGTVVEAGWNGDFGLMIRIRHSAEIETVYAHLSRLAPHLRTGRQVRQDEIIGHVGATGRASGPHLHFEIRRDGRALDPLALPPLPYGG
ncbi:MAG TPA: M23 family metallopeptidase [Alphaproteobacteria bacterium]